MKTLLFIAGLVFNFPNIFGEVCYGELGCFSKNPMWFNLMRPFFNPSSPESIDPYLNLCTRKHPDITPERIVKMWPKIELKAEFDYDPKKRTVFTIHGFVMDGPSLRSLKDGYLKNLDANVFMLDWSRGSETINYLQAAGNIRVVAAVLGRFGKYLVNEKKQSPKEIHCIGHSLGAHTCGLFGKIMKEAGMKIGWITGLDPAGPGFDFANNLVRFAPDDADYTEAYHTSALPLVPFAGLGIKEPVAQIDFYMNGGMVQPGCGIKDRLFRLFKKKASIYDLMNMNNEDFAEFTACHHMRAIAYYAASMEGCVFVGTAFTFNPTIFSAQLSIEVTRNLKRLKEESNNSTSKYCDSSNCHVAGFLSHLSKGTGVYYVETDSKPPYCLPLTGTQQSFLGGLLSKLKRKAKEFAMTALGMTMNVIGTAARIKNKALTKAEGFLTKLFG